MDKKEYQELVKNMRWSFSRLNGFDNGCRYCWFQTYVANRRDEGLDNYFSQFGSYCHEIHEDYYNGKIMIWDMEDEYRERYFQNVTYEAPPNKYTDIAQSYHDGGLEYFSNFTKYDFIQDKYEIVSVEEEANLIIGGYKFIGYIDLLLKDKLSGKYIVFDHKSKKDFKSIVETQEYARQLYLYAQYVYERYGEYPHMLVFNHFRNQKYTKIKFRESGLNEAKKWMVDTISRIMDCEDFSVTSDNFFGRYLCNFREDYDSHVIGKQYKLEDFDV